MTRDETVALFLQGREAWNNWANEMLAEKKRLEEAMLWNAADPTSEQTKAWMDRATADYSEVIFLRDDLVEWNNPRLAEVKNFLAKPNPKFKILSESEANFAEWIFPWNVTFAGGYFCCSLNLSDTKIFGSADFSRSYFLSDVWLSKSNFFNGFYFVRCTYFGEVRFTKNFFYSHAIMTESDIANIFVFTENICQSEVLLNQSNFRAPAAFWNNTFQNSVHLSQATFQNWVEFKESNFNKSAIFEDAVFEGAARFIGVKFSKAGGKADFFQATFKRFATFRDAHFHRDARFTAISAERAFDLRNATFDQLPDFTQANFREAPRLDNLKLGDKVEPGSFWRSLFRQTPAADDVIANYRSLRRLAIQAHDHANEQKFLKGEIRTRRNGEDKIWHFAWWSGVLYDAISDFGRSMARPLWIWVLSAAGFAALYLSLSVNGIAAPACALGNPGSPVLDALYLAYKNALLVIGWESEQKLNQVHACLYGQPQAPSSIALIQLGQNLISAAVLFLLLLGMRNRFKIK